VKYAWIQEHGGQFPVLVMCRCLQVSRSGYYGWRGREPSERERRRQQIAAAAAESHRASHGIYGFRKVYEDLRAAGWGCCAETVRRCLAEQGLFSVVKRKFVATTDSDHDHPVAPNLLDRDFSAAGANQKWAGDITYVATEEGWLYLAAIMDLYSRKIVGWSMSSRIDTSLVDSALTMAMEKRCPDEGLLHHSDRGGQYASGDYQQRLSRHGITCSMSRRGDCYDNACVESFFGSLKTEWIRGHRYASREAARTEVFKYIELFYNRQRRHASLGYLSPDAYEATN